MFGEIPTEENDSKTVHAFEALLEANEVRIIMPTALYTTCSTMARSLELQPYLIEGQVSCKDNNGQPVIINPTVIEKLKFDKEKEIYICESIKAPVTPETNNRVKEVLGDDNDPVYRPTFWEYMKASIYASF